MNEPIMPDSPAPRVFGRLAYRILVWALLAAIFATVLLIVLGNDIGFLAAMAVALFGGLLAALPAFTYLAYSRRPELVQVPRRTRRSVILSGIFLMLAAWFAWMMEPPVAFQAAGILAGLAGLAAIVLVLRATPADGPTILASGNGGAVGFVLALLITITLPKFGCACGTKGDAYRAMLKSDLRNLATAQEVFLADSGRFGSREELEKTKIYYPSTGDSLVVVARDSSWHAVATHWNLPDEQCSIWMGKQPAAGSFTDREGEVRCGSR